MFEAERCNKLGPDFELASPRSEDLLTSCVFGAFKYLSASAQIKVLEVLIHGATWPSIKPSVHLSGPVTFDFWPRLGPEGEIDLIVHTPQLIIGVEVKFLSPLSNRSNSDNQLARYSVALARKAQDAEKLACLIYLTAQSRPPLEDLPGASRHLEPDFEPSVAVLWTSWLEFAEAIQNITGNSELSESDRFLLIDVAKLLEWRGLTHFSGFKMDSLGPLQSQPAWFLAMEALPEPLWPRTSLPTLQNAWTLTKKAKKGSIP